MSYNCDSCNDSSFEVTECQEESCSAAICRHERYLLELFKRTDWLKTQLTGYGVGPFKIGYASDIGLAGADQTSLEYNMMYPSPDMVILGGNNNYPDGSPLTIDTNLAEFDTPISLGIVYPALGNVDVDTSPIGLAQTDKFTYLPGNKRYYHVYKEEASLDIYFLNSGIDSSGTLVEPDGNTIGSTQYLWFINELANSSGLFRVVVMHHPFLSGVEDAINEGIVYPELNWSFKGMGIDLFLTGNSNTAQHIQTESMHILDVSSGVGTLRNMDPGSVLYGSDAAIATMKWQYADPGDTGLRLYAEIDIIGKNMILSLKRIDNGVTVYAFNISK